MGRFFQKPVQAEALTQASRFRFYQVAWIVALFWLLAPLSAYSQSIGSCGPLTDDGGTSAGVSLGAMGFTTTTPSGSCFESTLRWDGHQSIRRGSGGFPNGYRVFINTIQSDTTSDNNLGVYFGTSYDNISFQNLTPIDRGDGVWNFDATTADAVNGTIFFDYGGESYFFDFVKPAGSDTLSAFTINVVDSVAPTLTSVAIASDNANTSLAKVGDEITITMTSDEALATGPTVTIAGEAAAVTGSGTSWTATLTVGAGTTEGAAQLPAQQAGRSRLIGRHRPATHLSSRLIQSQQPTIRRFHFRSVMSKLA